jgi:hypothetical protein
MRILFNDLWKLGSITDSSEAVGFPGINTQHIHLSKAWRSTNDASEWIRLDAGAAITPDSLAIIGHNLTSAAIVRIQANAADAWGAPSLDLRATPTDELMLVVFANASYRYWRVSIDDPANPAGFISIGRIFLCDRWEPNEPITQDFTPDVDDTTAVLVSITGQTFADLGVRQRKYSFSFGTIRDDTKVAYEAVLASIRFHDPVIVDLMDRVTPLTSQGIQRLYATMISAPSFSAIGAWGWNDSGITFKEAL